MKANQAPHPTTAPGKIPSTQDDLVLTPGGWRPKSKALHIEEGHHVLAEDGKLKKVHTASKTVVQELDDVKKTSGEKPNMPSNVSVPDEKKVKSKTKNEIIPSYGEGWITYAEWNNTSGNPINYFTTEWVVPPAPTTYNGQTIFIFNGMQSSDHILQPVLQYGPSAAGGGNYWSIVNWYVSSSGAALYSSLVQVDPGQSLQGVMTLTDQSGGLCSYTSSFPDFFIDLQVYDVEELTYVYESLEAYEITTPSDYPAGKVSMTGIRIFIGGLAATPSWYPVNMVTDCNQMCNVVSNASSGGQVDLFLFTTTIRSNYFSNVFLRMNGTGVTHYVSTGAGTVNCQYGASIFERYVITIQTGGSYTIQSAQFPNVLLRMDGSGVTTSGGTVNCQYAPPGSWEKFNIVKQTDGTYYVASTAFTTTYLRMDGTGVTSFLANGGGTVNCSRSVGAWEKYVIFPDLY